MAMPQTHVRYTVDDLESMPDDGNRREIIYGELFVTPAPRFWHQAAVLELVEILRPYARSVGLRTFVSPAAVRASHTTQVEPDLFVFPRRPDVDGTTRSVAMSKLLLAVEILSPSTTRSDRGPKRELYLSHAIAEYWIVDVDARCIEVWTPQHPEPRLATDTLSWQPRTGHDALTIDLSALFDSIRS